VNAKLLQSRFQTLIDQAPREDRMGDMERLLAICERISRKAYGAPGADPEFTIAIASARCCRDAAWLAEFALRLLSQEI